MQFDCRGLTCTNTWARSSFVVFVLADHSLTPVQSSPYCVTVTTQCGLSCASWPLLYTRKAHGFHLAAALKALSGCIEYLYTPGPVP